MKLLIPILLTMVLLMPMVSAELGYTSCINSSYQRSTYVWEDGSDYFDRYCELDCNNNTGSCNPLSPNSDFLSMIVITLLGVAFLFVVIGMKYFGENVWYMKVFFLIMAMYLVIMSVYIVSAATLSWTNMVGMLNTVYTGVIFFVLVLIFYFIIAFLRELFKNMGKSKSL